MQHTRREENKVFVSPPRGGKALFFDIPSASVPGQTYKLRVMPDGEVRCQCTGYVLGGFKCRHIKEFLSKYNEKYECFAKDIDSNKLVEDKEKERAARFSAGVPEITPNMEI